MEIKVYQSNIDITFEDGRQKITLYADDYFNEPEKYTEAEEREGLSNCFVLTESELDEIISVLTTNEWIEA